MDVIVRTCDESHLEAICAIEKQASQTGYSQNILCGMLINPDYVVLGAFADDALVGYLALNVCGLEAEIHNVAVLNEYRQNGIGAKLTKETKEICKAKGFEKIFLEVAESNAAAIKLYEKSGFRQTGKRPNYYGKEAALLMDAEVTRQ